jgi:hypothetical protein
MEMDIVDEQVETMGRAFLAMSFGCARCHDHKFDPISTRDYYGLAGIFKSTRTMEHFKKIARWWENSLASDAELQAAKKHADEIARVKAEIQHAVEAANAALNAAGGPDLKLPENPEEAYPADIKANLVRMREGLAGLEKSAPVVATAMGVTEGSVTDVPVHIRGSHLSLGEIVPRHFPPALAGEVQPPLDSRQSGRRQLAEWLTSPDHPLTARVIVNRVWRWHFGHGIVRSTDNFGLTGDRPTNPHLLDHLARRLVANGWSLKPLHRDILLSRTYQMSSRYDSAASAIDPENRHYWQFPMQRLNVESIRDALLAVSGELDRTMGGKLLPIQNREFLFDHTSKDATRYESRRRSLYLPVIRNHLFNMFQLFDYPDPTLPTGDRNTTTIAPQALFMLNSELAGDVSQALAGRLLACTEADGVPDDAARIQRLYETAYGRTASRSESVQALEFLKRFESALGAGNPDAEQRRQRAWQALLQVTLCANEFVYIP